MLGGWWASPTTHLLIALFVLPVAAMALIKGFKIHQSGKVVVLGLVGAGFVLLGTAFPWLQPLLASDLPATAAGAAGAAPDVTPLATETQCTDCCPSVEVNATTGEWDWKFPPASWLTMLGGIGLVSAHWANLRFCQSCKKCSESSEAGGPFFLS